MAKQCRERGYAAPVDILMDIGALKKSDYELWRKGSVPFLEQVCQCNLHKLSLIMKEIRSYAAKNHLKASFTFYRKWGKGKKVQLRFSKSNDPKIEQAYATHYVLQKVSKPKTEDEDEKI